VADEPLDSPPFFETFEKTGYLGAGSFGHVYRVRDASGEYALKWLRSDADDDAKARFENEAWALQTLSNPSIPRLISRGTHSGRPWIAMSLAPGKPLKELWEEQLRDGTPSGQLRVLDITIAVLEALSYMHARGIYHRDVKHANILATESVSSVTLIDFGFCRSIEQPAHAPSFWNVGASRFAPPNKLDYPSRTHPTHDVFAVGVVAYLLLTNKFPWQVAETEDRGRLRDAMQRTTPIHIEVANRFVDQAVARFVHRLIVINDDARPTAATALEEAKRIKATLAARVAAPAIRKDAIAFPRVMRDAVHGDIRLTDFEASLIDTREYQRLRRMKQLGFANLVYPCAEHTRLTHSVGTMFVADKILRSIAEITGDRLHPEERLLARTYALVHDVTHIAFGHTFEDELGLFDRHDRNEERIGRLILSDRSALGNVLRSTDYGRAALAFFDPRGDVEDRLRYLRELVESPAGADVIDYIDRDSLHCGLDHQVDSAIFRRYRITTSPDVEAEPHLISQLYGRHGVRLDAEYAVEWLLLQRFGLFLKVYTHPAKIAAGAMLGKAVTLAIRGRGKQLDARKIELLGDDELIGRLAATSADPIRRLGRALRERKLFKPCFRAGCLQGGDIDLERYAARREEWRNEGLFSPEGRLDIERKLAKKAKISSADVIFYCPSEAPGYQKIRHFVEREPGKTEPLADRVHLRAAERHLRLWSLYLFVSDDVTDEKRSALVEETSAVSGLKNEAETKPRQELLF